MNHIDHRDMTPPSLRITSSRPAGDTGSVTVWDLRIAQPNVAAVEMPTVHSLEHFLGSILPAETDYVVNVAPMGCQTGFYVVTAGMTDFATLAADLGAALRAILQADAVPLANTRECGWARNHDLAGAQAVAAWLLSREAGWPEPTAAAPTAEAIAA
jgi:S-ribosylhomocysteine lyase